MELLMTDDPKRVPYYEDEVFTKTLTREDTLEKQIQFITYSYSKGFWRDFEYGIKALILLLPKQVRAQFNPLKYDPSEIGIEQHYQQFSDIQTKIEDDTNMIWKKKFIKTYE